MHKIKHNQSCAGALHCKQRRMFISRTPGAYLLFNSLKSSSISHLTLHNFAVSFASEISFWIFVICLIIFLFTVILQQDLLSIILFLFAIICSVFFKTLLLQHQDLFQKVAYYIHRRLSSELLIFFIRKPLYNSRWGTSRHRYANV